MNKTSPILLVTDFYPPFIGGAELQMQLLARELATKGYEVHVVTLWHNGLLELETDDGITIHRVKGLLMKVPFLFKEPNQRRYHPPFPEPAITLQIRQLIRDIQPKTIHVFGWITYSVALASIGTQIPIVISTHDFGLICAKCTLLYQGKEMCSGPSFRKCMSCAPQQYGFPKALVTVTSIKLGRMLLSHKVSAFHENSSYVHNVIKRFFPEKQEGSDNKNTKTYPHHLIPNISPDVEVGVQDTSYLDKLPDEPFILFVGAIKHHKGIHHLLNAYTMLESAPPLVLIGTIWPDSPKSYPSGVILIESAPHDVVMEAWNQCLFGVFPSIWAETFGNVVIEAMSKGKPVIASNIGGPVDIIVDGESGLLIPPADEDALAQSMKLLCEDHILREKLGQAGRIRVEEKFSATAIIPKFEALYQSASNE